MTALSARSLAASICAVFFGIAQLASAQDLLRYRDAAFGSSVSAVVAMTLPLWLAWCTHSPRC